MKAVRHRKCNRKESGETSRPQPGRQQFQIRKNHDPSFCGIVVFPFLLFTVEAVPKPCAFSAQSISFETGSVYKVPDTNVIPDDSQAGFIPRGLPLLRNNVTGIM
jgi:hypothetical protein